METFDFVRQHEDAHLKKGGERREANFFGTVDTVAAEKMYRDVEQKAGEERTKNPEKYQRAIDVMKKARERTRATHHKENPHAEHYIGYKASLEMARRLNTERVSNPFINRFVSSLYSHPELPEEFEVEYYTTVLFLRNDQGDYLKLPADFFHSADAFVDFVDGDENIITVTIDGKMNNKTSSADVVLRYPMNKRETDEDIMEMADDMAQKVIQKLLEKVQEKTLRETK